MEKTLAIAARERLLQLDFIKDRTRYDLELERLLKLSENLPDHREGYRTVYLDKYKNPTIGTGFNMGKPGSDQEDTARKEWKYAFPNNKPNFDDVRSGKITLEQTQIDRLLQINIMVRREELFGIRPDFKEPFPGVIVYKDLYRELSANVIAVIEHAYFNGGPPIVGRRTKFFEDIQNYVKTSESRYLNYALWEILKSSNKQKDDGIQRRREIEANVFNTYGIDLSKLEILPYADPFGFYKELQRLRREAAEKFVDTVIQKHHEGFIGQMQKLTGREGPFPTLDTTSLRTQFLRDFDTSLSNLGDALLDRLERDLRAIEQGAVTREQIRQQQREELQQNIFQRAESLTTYFSQQMDRESQQEAGIENYVWRSMDDEKVRDSHAANDDRVFGWDDPPNTGHPGADYGCRCWAEPTYEEPGMGPIIPTGIPRIEIYGTHLEDQLSLNDAGDDNIETAADRRPMSARDEGAAARKDYRHFKKAFGISRPLKPPKPPRRPLIWADMTRKAKRLYLDNLEKKRIAAESFKQQQETESLH